MVSVTQVREVLKVYAKAWCEQDPELILTIFTSDAAYHERVLRQPFRGHAEIKAYWQAKVVEEQEDIRFKLHDVYVDGETAIAEWEARFYSNKDMETIHMKEVAILEFRDGKIKSLREYWQSEHLSGRQ